MSYINYNGKIVDANTAIIHANNRGLRYGDGIFETIKLQNGKLILVDEHFDRLWQGLQLLQFDIPKFFTPQQLIEAILLLAKKNKLANARIRLTLIRGQGGMYDAKNHYPNYIIETMPLPEDNGIFNSNGLQLCFYTHAIKPIDTFSNLKHNNYLPYFMGALFAKNNKCNDAIIFNNNGNICDTTIANIFFIKENAIYTPALTEGCVNGVVRNWLIVKIKEMGFVVIEKSITKEAILAADEVFLTNSIYNIRWVKNIENSNYNNTITYKIATTIFI